MRMVTERRGRFRWTGPVVAGLVMVAGCTTTTLDPATGSTPDGGVSTTVGTSVPSVPPVPSVPSVPSAETAPSQVVTDATTTAVPTSGGSATASAPPETTGSSTVATYTPPADAEATEGDCPYLTTDQVQADTGQRMGATRIRAAAPAPVCEFVRNDGGFLATVRVLQLDSDANAVAAVDFYVPRDASNPETRPAGWAGGSFASDDGSTYGVSKGTYAVIAATNQKQSVYARLLVVNAIENLGL